MRQNASDPENYVSRVLDNTMAPGADDPSLLPEVSVRLISTSLARSR